MLLKKLEMNGFKSFADKVTVDFVPGMTAVVGPNGSGKSNITEAIRWVLGEQSAKSLRGGRMGDVIFAGSDSRKPINFAEVSLVLENEDHFLPLDYSEIAITRRIYRNGDSEFLINHEQCRLKDIVELFMDSGLGRESFSIISQGKIDEILNSKPEERRTIFEEAAGVLKYKQRKKQAEQKLTETEENLNRVQDILYELEGQLEPLEMQASIAKDYLFQKEELEKYEVSLLATEIGGLETKLEKERDDFAANSQALFKLREKIREEEQHVTEQKRSLTELDEKIDANQQKLLQLAQSLEKLEGERNLQLERKKHSSETEQTHQETLTATTAKITQLEAERKQLLEEKLEKETKLELADRQRKAYERNLAELDNITEDTIENKKSDYIELKHRQTTIHNDVGYIDRQLKQIDARLTRLEQENGDSSKERIARQEEIEATENTLASIRKQLEEQLTTYETNKKELTAAEQSLAQEEGALYKHYQAIEQVKARKETLAELADDYAGFFQGVREVLKAKTEIPGIIGALVELVTIPEHYQTAMEIALNNNAQHIVTKDERAAREAIQYLKTKRAGRATFLPLTTIQPRELPAGTLKQLEAHPAFEAVASQIVTHDPSLAPVIQNALGTTILAKDLKGANELAKLVHYRYRIVSLAGDVVNAGGSMTGGATTKGRSSILTRKNELEQLESQLKSLQQQTSQFESSVAAGKVNVQTKREQLEEIRSTGEKLRIQEQEWTSKFSSGRENLERQNHQLKIYDYEKADNLKEKNELEARKQALLTEEATNERLLIEMNEAIETMLADSKIQDSKRTEVLHLLADLKETITAQKVELGYTSTEEARLTDQLNELYQQKQAAEDRLESIQTIRSESRTEEEYTQLIEQTRTDKATCETAAKQLREKRIALQESLTKQEETLQQKNEQSQYYSEQRNKAEVAISRYEVDMQSRINRLQEAYELDFEQAKENILPDVDQEQLRSKVRLLKRSIDELGVVNLGSIEEFERIEERFQFLNGQQEDLLAAKETLFDVMGEMDEEMKIRFEASFEAIQTEFAIVFPELFGGGEAKLVLTEPENLLTTGIDIIVQPPGKKLQNLSLRSGGERALTAIALLFAIIRVRPVPFCILDEVEAALDEANVIRFSRYLKQFESDTQFIVITHRKGTMEEADVLYGVTMQESGVSKLVSVRLEETEELVK